MENPKDGIGSRKLPLHLVPPTALAMTSLGMYNGKLKYGEGNFRATPVRASVYLDAVKRHIDQWAEGEECDPVDGVPHLGAAMANLAIIIDTAAHGTLVDDRTMASEGGYRRLVDRLEPLVAGLDALHAGRHPVHHTRNNKKETDDALGS